MNSMHTRIGAGVALVALGGFAGYAVSDGSGGQPARDKSSAKVHAPQVRGRNECASSCAR
jgi:hypothetical protein